MSNIGSSALSTKQHTTRTPNVQPLTAAQQKFDTGTMNMLDEARGVVENAVGQGQDLNPMIYQMLGLEPQYQDNTADLQKSQQEMDQAQQQLQQAQKTIDQIKAVPQGRRSPQQKQQLKALNKQLPALQKTLGDATNAHGKLQTMPKTITGLSRMDPSQIPANSPFSSQNPLNQAQATEAQRLNQYLSGNAPVDPTLTHQYAAAEQSLRAKLAQRYGPDYENTTVGQMALQNFSRQKNEAFATWNQQQVQNYNNLAFQGQANLQQLLAGQIGLMREPSTTAMNMGNELSNLAGGRLNQQQIAQQWNLGRAGVTQNTVTTPPIGPMAASGVSSLLGTPTQGGQSTVGGDLYNWASGGTPATSAGAYQTGMEGGQIAAPSALSNWASSGAAGAGAGEAAAGMSTAEGAEMLL